MKKIGFAVWIPGWYYTYISVNASCRSELQIRSKPSSAQPTWRFSAPKTNVFSTAKSTCNGSAKSIIGARFSSSVKVISTFGIMMPSSFSCVDLLWFSNWALDASCVCKFVLHWSHFQLRCLPQSVSVCNLWENCHEQVQNNNLSA